MKRTCNFFFALLLIALFTIASSGIIAQVAPFPGGPSTPTPPCWPPPCVPIDGGIGILLVIGVLFGGKKIYKKD